MSSPTAAVSTRSMPAHEEALARRVLRFLIGRRISVSVVVFLLLLLEDILVGIKPHDVADWHDWHSVLGVSLVLAGLLLRSWAAGTLVKRFQLTTTGVYALVRNPLYVGSFVMMVGFCQLIDDPENIFFILGPFVAIYAIKVRDEERILSKNFGQRWQAYAQATPRFFPRRLTSSMFANWTIARWLFNREYKSLATALAGLAALKVWHAL
ncbi:MAG TPA: isoprenylcysteine carboxylmethyltransferase family protein [Pirellulales bacterium]|nr:isoprenylcysteine carboxylmethyltransferase family protein [Pirellulales bacterium]